MEQKFYICKHCGNIIAKVKDTGVPVICCGEPMSEIIPGTTDAAVEKHVPVWTVENGIVHVKVGFALCEGDEVEAVYAYCNLHSLWKA